MDLLDHIRKEIVSRAYRYGLVLTPEALEYVIYSVKDPDTLFRELRQRGVRIVRMEDILGRKEEIEGTQEKEDVEVFAPEEPFEDTTEIVRVTECEKRVRVLLYVDPDEIEPASWERERERILRNRLEYLERELLNRHRMAPVNYDRAIRSEEERDIVGLILKIEERGNGKTMVYVENGEEATRVLFTGGENRWKLDYLDLDSVVGLRVVSNGEILIARDILFPFLSRIPKPVRCMYRLLVVPEAYKHNIEELPIDKVDGLALLSNVANVYRITDPKSYYRSLDEFLASLDIDVFVVPGMYDVTRTIPPHPPIDESLMPNSAAADHVHLLGSPAIVRVGQTQVLLYDGEYYAHTGKPPETMIYTRLVQPNISSYPYRSSKDYSLIRRSPNIILTPVGGKTTEIGEITVVKEIDPYIVDIYGGKVIRL